MAKCKCGAKDWQVVERKRNNMSPLVYCGQCGAPLAETNSSFCETCGEIVSPQVCKSYAGYYVGLWHRNPNCCDSGPWSRLSNYFATEYEAQAALDSGNYKTREF